MSPDVNSILKTYAANSMRRFPASQNNENCLGPVFVFRPFTILDQCFFSKTFMSDGYFHIFVCEISIDPLSELKLLCQMDISTFLCAKYLLTLYQS